MSHYIHESKVMPSASLVSRFDEERIWGKESLDKRSLQCRICGTGVEIHDDLTTAANT
jgi:hypothetical protein